MSYPLSSLKILNRVSISVLHVFFLFVFFFIGCKKVDEFTSVKNASSNLDATQGPAGKPNIVMILGDDIGHDIPVSFGGSSYQTPNLDMMAQTGMKFTSTYSSPLCSPSRVCIMTGKYNFRNYSEWGILDPSARTFGDIMRSAGYATFVAGKWQLDGGDSAAHVFGFDDYSLWNPIKDLPAGEHYKDPSVYENGQFLPKSYTKGKYGDDIFTDRILSFIDANKSNKFFAYFPITLCHSPFAPTPEDAEFATWDTRGNHSDTSFFPSMVKYMDEKVGVIINKLKEDSIYNNTIVIFVGDNGTPDDIYSWWNGKLVQGGKSKSTSAGTNVPMFITWPNRIAGGQVNDNLIDFSDFLPTFTDIVKGTITSDYGIIDGKSFYKQLIGGSYTPRDWVFNHYQPNTNKGNDILLRWVQDHTYKLYDSTGTFFNIVLDPDEKTPLKNRNLTPQEKQTKRNFQQVLNSMHN